MRTVSVGLAAFMLAGMMGCNKQSAPGGGTTKAAQVTLSGPSATSIKQGETQTISVKVERGKDFQQNVKLAATAPAGTAASGALATESAPLAPAINNANDLARYAA